MSDHHPFLVLSTKELPATVRLAVDLGPIPDRPDEHSFVLCQPLKSLDWRAQAVKPHPMGIVSPGQNGTKSLRSKSKAL